MGAANKIWIAGVLFSENTNFSILRQGASTRITTNITIMKYTVSRKSAVEFTF
jgi:hypothetical protein